MNGITPINTRWDALDILRGFSIVGMLLNLNPGAWDLHYNWINHAVWEGATLIDMVMPTFLFCVGAVIPFTLMRRFEKDASRYQLMVYIIKRSLALILVGLFINFYPGQPLENLRIPGVLQRIGMCFCLAGLFTLAFTQLDSHHKLHIRPLAILSGITFLFFSYWFLLAYVPVPEFGAGRFDSLGSWPCFIDRALFGTNHLFIYGLKTDGQITFDPDGFLSGISASFNVLVGVLAGYIYQHKQKYKTEYILGVVGFACIMVGLLLSDIYPIIKSIWTGSFALLSSGFSLLALSILMLLLNKFKNIALLFPMRVFGSNALLIYILCFLVMPLWDAPFMGSSIRQYAQQTMSQFFEPHFASFSVSVIYLTIAFFILLPLYKKRWFLRL